MVLGISANPFCYTCSYTVYVRESGNGLKKVEIGVWLHRYDTELINVKIGATDYNIPYLTVIISSIKAQGQSIQVSFSTLCFMC